jgi:hypothetical protein
MSWKCNKCDIIYPDSVAQGLAYNIPDVTPGPMYYCLECEPIKSADEIIENIKLFMGPSKED